MAKTAARKGLLAGCLLLVGGAPALAQSNVPPVETLLNSQFNPKQKDVVISTPTDAERASCKVKMVQGAKTGSVGYLLLDAKEQPVRRFMGAAKKPIETYSYFKDGVEVYREIDGNGNGRVDQFRWLNGAGMKWGIDSNEDGKIDAWRMISAEEVGQEAFQALASHDFDRLKALFLTEAEMAALKLPAPQVKRLSDLQTKAAQKFEDVTRGLPQLGRATFVRVETAPPSCVLGEQIGSETDLIKYAARSILYETEIDKDGKKERKHEWLSTGEMILVGLAWRLVDVPNPETAPGSGNDVPTPAQAGVNAELTKLLEQLTDIDTKLTAVGGAAANPLIKARIQLITTIMTKVDVKEHETWYRQLIDNHAAAAQNGDASATKDLDDLIRAVTTKHADNKNLAAYGVYRAMWTRYAKDMEDTKKSGTEIAKIHSQWLGQLEQFVKDYPTAEDTTSEALHQLGMGAEFAGKDQEAKGWYGHIFQRFPKHILADKARGAVERLNLVPSGNPLKLTGTTLDGAALDVALLKGKIVVVYYWTSGINQCLGDFARLTALKAKHNIELVGVNLDDSADTAQRFVKANQCPGVHLFAAAPKGESGLSSPLAVQYGINGLPTMFLVGRDGKVLSTRLQIDDLESELKKAQ